MSDGVLKSLESALPDRLARNGNVRCPVRFIQCLLQFGKMLDRPGVLCIVQWNTDVARVAERLVRVLLEVLVDEEPREDSAVSGRDEGRRYARAGPSGSSRRMAAPPNAHGSSSPEDLRHIPMNSGRIPMDPHGVYTRPNGFRGKVAHALCSAACAPDSASVHRRFAQNLNERRAAVEIMADVLEKMDQVGEVVRMASEVVARAGGDAANVRASSSLYHSSSRAAPQARGSASPSRSSPLRAGGPIFPSTSSVTDDSGRPYASAHSSTRYSYPGVTRHASPTGSRNAHASIPRPPANPTRLFNLFIAWMKRSPDAVVPHVCRSAPLVSSPAVLLALVALVARNPRVGDAPAYGAQAPDPAHDESAPSQREAFEASHFALNCLAHYLAQCGGGRRDGRREDLPTGRSENSNYTHHQGRYPFRPPIGDPRQSCSTESPFSGGSRHRQDRRRHVWRAWLADLNDQNARAFVYDCTRIVHFIDSEDRRTASVREQGHKTTVVPGRGNQPTVNRGHYPSMSLGHSPIANRGQQPTSTQGFFILRERLLDDALYVARRLQQRGVVLSELECGSELLKAMRRE